MNTTELIETMRGFEIDHEPDGWPAIRMREVSALCDALEKAERKLGVARKALTNIYSQTQEGATHALATEALIALAQTGGDNAGT